MASDTMNVTKRGAAFADRLGNYSGHQQDPAVISKLCRHATSHHRLCESECNGHPAAHNPHIDARNLQRLQNNFEAHVRHERESVEKRIANLLPMLPGVAQIEFDGDPRGPTVKLHLDNGAGDCIDGSLGVPQGKQ
jgi:hypothetical protein